jgi:hypothetical protein
MGANKLRPAVLGGLLVGVLSALPIVNIGNVCCCLWVICGGMLAAYLLQQGQPFAITVADGALVGLLAGLFGGVIAVLLSVPFEMMMAPFQAQFLERFLENAGDMPSEARDLIERFGRPGNPVMIVFRLIITSIVFSVFGLLGGLLGAALFKKGAPPQPAGATPQQ